MILMGPQKSTVELRFNRDSDPSREEEFERLDPQSQEGYGTTERPATLEKSESNVAILAPRRMQTAAWRASAERSPNLLEMERASLQSPDSIWAQKSPSISLR